MSQRRIDQYFKATSSNSTIIGPDKQDNVKLSNRLNNGRKLAKIDKPERGRTKNSVKNNSTFQLNEKKIQRSGNSLTKIKVEAQVRTRLDDSENKRMQKLCDAEIQSWVEEKYLMYEMSNRDESAISTEVAVCDSVGTTSPRKTVKGFATACNSPRANRSPTKISLKRSSPSNSPYSSSPAKRTLDLRDSVVDENNAKIKIEHSVVESVKNIDGSHSIDINEKVSPKKRKINDGSPSKKSPIAAGWKIAFSIETAERSMTALSSDWQGTLNETSEAILTSLKRVELFSQEIVETSLSDKKNEIDSSSVEKNCKIIAKERTKKVESEKIVDAEKSSTIISESSKKNFASSKESKKIGDHEKSSKKNSTSSNESKKICDFEKSPTKLSSTLNSEKKSFEHPKTPSKVSPGRSYEDCFDMELMTQAIDNLNQAKEGIIVENNFNLDEIYSKETFTLEYGKMRPDASLKYEISDATLPDEKHAIFFINMIVNVFAEPLNCGYFNDDELHVIYSILTLSRWAKSLLARMLKRKRGWHRTSNVKYPEICDNLQTVFEELVVQNFLDCDIGREDLTSRLNLLSAEEIRELCQTMKIDHRGRKNTLIDDIVKLANKKKSLFPGMRTPGEILASKIQSILGLCIRLNERVENLLDRIFILLVPNQDPKENMSEVFRMFIEVHYGDCVFPETPDKRLPIFRDRSHLMRYATARSAWNRIINSCESKDWENVRKLGKLAHERLKPYFESNKNRVEKIASNVPSHVKRFDDNYVWMKVMSRSVEAFKKKSSTMDVAVEFLRLLVSPENDLPSNRVRWYSELALVESYHRKNHEASATITVEALMMENISEVDVAEMLERARKLTKCKKLSVDTKERLNVAVRLREEMLISNDEPIVNEIEANMVSGNTTGSKSTWSVSMGDSGTGYLRVEHVARFHYRNRGYTEGIHCEGALPNTIFATLMWPEIYEINVAGAFVSPYQQAPLDIFTSRFYDNRRERIDDKLKLVRSLDIDCLSDMMQEDFARYRHYSSLIHGNLVVDAEDFKMVIMCLGIDAVVGICERLASNYTQWKSGFPDLIVWNPIEKKCKIVEVKGPGDSLSPKQKLWIQFLGRLGVDVEVCFVKGTTRKYAT